MWVSVNSGSWWWTGRPGVLWFMGSQRVGDNWVTDLIWSDLNVYLGLPAFHVYLGYFTQFPQPPNKVGAIINSIPIYADKEIKVQSVLSDSFKGLEPTAGRAEFRTRQRGINICAGNHFALLVLKPEHPPEACFCHNLTVHLSEHQLPPLQNGENIFCSVGKLEDHTVRSRTQLSILPLSHSSCTGSSSLAKKPVKVKLLVAQSCLSRCNPKDCSLPGSCVHGILQVRILEWVTMPFFRFPTQGSNPSLLHCRQILDCLSHQGSPKNHICHPGVWNGKSTDRPFLAKLSKVCLSFQMASGNKNLPWSQQYSMEMKRLWTHQIPALSVNMSPWADLFNPLSLCFQMYKMGVVRAPKVLYVDLEYREFWQMVAVTFLTHYIIITGI